MIVYQEIRKKKKHIEYQLLDTFYVLFSFSSFTRGKRNRNSQDDYRSLRSIWDLFIPNIHHVMR